MVPFGRAVMAIVAAESRRRTQIIFFMMRYKCLELKEQD